MMMGPSLAGSGKSGVSFLLLSLGIREDGSFFLFFFGFFLLGRRLTRVVNSF